MKRHDADRALRHPLRVAHDQVEHLVDVADLGESAATPAVIVGGLAVLLVALVAAVITVAVLVEHFAGG